MRCEPYTGKEFVRSEIINGGEVKFFNDFVVKTAAEKQEIIKKIACIGANTDIARKAMRQNTIGEKS